MRAKQLLGIAIAILLAFVAGFVWGTLGRSNTAAALQASDVRGDLLAARAAVLDARVAIYSANFGEASSHLEDARTLLGSAQKRLQDLGRDDEAARVTAALAKVDEAQRTSVRLDASANEQAGEAAKILSDLLTAQRPR